MADDTMATDVKTEKPQDQIGEINKYDFRTKSEAVFKARKGIDAEIVNQISDMKDEPDWMREFRLKSLEIFESKPLPKWGGDIAIDFQDIYYYLKPTDRQGRTWDEVPQEIKDTFDKLGIPEAEKKFLAGVKAQFESEVVYGSLEGRTGRSGRYLHRHGHGGARTPGSGARVFLDGHSAPRQQICSAQFGRLVGRFVHLCAQGRQDRLPAASLLPHQRREHGAIRADPDHL